MNTKELLAQCVPDGWQPIETAPKDVTLLLYGAKRLEMCVGMNHSRDGWVTDTTSEWASMYPPTHWMPLPTAPGASAPPAPQADKYVPCQHCGKNTASDNPSQWCPCPKQASVVQQEPPKVNKASVLELGREIGLIGWVSEDGMYFQFTETENASSLLVDLVQQFILPAQQAKPQPLSDEQEAILNFLLGASDMDGVWFGDKHPQHRGQFWWRERLRQVFQKPAHGIQGGAA